MELSSLNDVFEEQLGDLYDAEKQLVAALPKVATAAHSDELRKAFQEHLDETRGHVERLEQIFGDLGIPMPTETCEAMHGLIREVDQIVTATGDQAAKDAALIAAAQRIEHYEIACYGTRAHARARARPRRRRVHPRQDARRREQRGFAADEDRHGRHAQERHQQGSRQPQLAPPAGRRRARRPAPLLSQLFEFTQPIHGCR
jgi:ferritin-like metal-binding protein YciE